MGIVKTEITLKNTLDVGKALEGLIKPEEVRQMTTTALVDTGAWTMVIDETTREKLGLRIVGRSTGTLANGEEEEYDLAGPLEVWWKDRRTVCDALVLPNADDILFGAIPLEAMDLTINPKRELIGAHGDRIVHKVK